MSIAYQKRLHSGLNISLEIPNVWFGSVFLKGLLHIINYYKVMAL